MLKPLLVSLTAILALALGPARASTIQYTFSVDQCTGGCGPVNTVFGTITLADTVADTVQVTINLNTKIAFIRTGIPATVAWNLSGDPDVTADGFPSGWSLLSSSAGSLHMTGQDYFEYGLSCCNGKNGGSNIQSGPLTFTLSGSGLSTSSFEATPADHFFAMDIYNAATSGLGAGNTGVVE